MKAASVKNAIGAASFLVLFMLCIQRRASRDLGQPATTSMPAPIATSARRRLVTKSLADMRDYPYQLSSYVMFVNRVPQAGAELLVLLLQRLQGANSFKHIRLKAPDFRPDFLVKDEKSFVNGVTDVIRQQAVPLSFDSNVHFVNFTAYDKQSPTYINMIRDPLDMILSRYSTRRKKTQQPITRHDYATNTSPDNEELRLCLLKEHSCTLEDGTPYDFSISYFCGLQPKCSSLNDDWALDQAKENVEKYFPVVGVLEEVNATLQVIESQLPYFFRGAENLYKEKLGPNKANSKWAGFAKPDIRLREHFTKMLRTEYEFYNWVRARLFQQLQIINGHSHR